MSLVDFVVSVVLYCQCTDGSVTSWGRTRLRNAREHGVSRSPHLVWLGVDVAYDAPAPPTDGAAIAERLGLRLIREGDHDHLQPLGWKA